MIAATMFSGIGAPEVAMPEWDWRWCAEIEKFPCAVLKARHPQSTNLGDINAKDFVARAEAAGRPDVLVFGSPCQDFSVAGQRVGLDGARGNLALVALGIVNELRPRWVVFENVPGLLSSRSGSAEAERAVREGPVGGRGDSDEDSDFAAFLSLVQQCGYFGFYRITDAQYAGVPQRRHRIFAVFHIGDWRPAAAVLLEPESMRGDHPPSREAREGVAPTISARPSGGGGLGTDFDLDGGLIESSVERLNPDGPVGSVSSKWSKGSGGPAGDECYNLVAAPEAFNNTGQGWWNNADVAAGLRDMSAGGGSKEATLIAFDTTQITHPENRSQPDDRSLQLSQSGHPPAIAFDCKAGGNTSFSIGDLPGSMRGEGHGGGHLAICFTGKDYGGDATVDQTPTLRAMAEIDGNANAGGQLAVAYALGSHSGTEGEVSNKNHETGGPVGSNISEEQAYSLRAGRTQSVASVFDKGDQDPVLMTGTAVRRLTPRECERLQAFPDDYTLIQYRGAAAADGPRYKALGNAMNVNEVRWVLERIELFESTIRRKA